MKKRNIMDQTILNQITGIKRIPGFEEYGVSKLGYVISFRRKQPRLMTPCLNVYGYPVVTLRIKEKQITEAVHRLVAVTFLNTKSTRLVQVNHKDGNKKNNCLNNLEITTAKENTCHAILNGLRRTYGSQNPSAKLNESDVKQIKKLIKKHGEIRGFCSNLAKQYRVTKELIYAIKKQKVWGHLK